MFAAAGAIGVAAATTLAMSLPAAADSKPVPAPPAQVVWPFVDFQTVPRLGDENVRGSGCGGATEIPAEIPDGVWAGQIDGFFDGDDEITVHELADIDDADELAFDLWCIYRGEAAASVAANPKQHIVLNNPEYMVVNNNERNRNVELDDDFIVRYAARLVDGRCIDPGPAAVEVTNDDDKPYYQSAQAWLYIDDGEAQWAFIDCKD